MPPSPSPSAPAPFQNLSGRNPNARPPSDSKGAFITPAPPTLTRPAGLDVPLPPLGRCRPPFQWPCRDASLVLRVGVIRLEVCKGALAGVRGAPPAAPAPPASCPLEVVRARELGKLEVRLLEVPPARPLLGKGGSAVDGRERAAKLVCDRASSTKSTQ